MDPTTAISLEGLNLIEFGQQVIWLSLRIGGLLMLSPFLGTGAVPRRIRLILALALSVAIAPLVPAPALVAGLDASTFLAVARELAIGAALGFLMRLVMEAIALAGELIAQGMGLSFAQMIDPLRGVQSGVVGQWFTVVAGLTFFAVDAHLALLGVLFESYRVLPAGAQPVAFVELLTAVPMFSTVIFVGGVSLALPVMVAMITVNLSFGVMARTAPSLNPIQVGLPAALLVGWVLLIAMVPFMLDPLRALFEQALTEAQRLVR